MKDYQSIISNHLDIWSNFMKEDFRMNLDAECGVNGVESPIEIVLLSAIELTIRISGLNDSKSFYCRPQYKIGKYRCDFYFRYDDLDENDKPVTRQLIVECDSQAFHDRSETERRYEKTRDRFLIKAGYTIFHYTGKEILEDCLKISAEILGWLTHESPDNYLSTVLTYAGNNHI